MEMYQARELSLELPWRKYWDVTDDQTAAGTCTVMEDGQGGTSLRVRENIVLCRSRVLEQNGVIDGKIMGAGCMS